jgi:hypothetical protein
MAEISAMKNVWPKAKHQLCWWHLKKAVGDRLKGKLATVTYNPWEAYKEFPTIINTDFVPSGASDPSDREELLDEELEEVPEPKRGRRRAVIPKPPEFDASAEPAPTPGPNSIFIKLTIPEPMRTQLPMNTSQPSPHPASTSSSDSESDDESPEELVTPATAGSRRVFCPSELRESVITMLEKHFCAHPSIPGYSAPSAEGIREWAISEMYHFCKKHDLRELWAYLWECWYKAGRWELWARSAGSSIPRLKTTMMLESQ